MTVRRLIYAGILVAGLLTAVPLLQARLWYAAAAALILAVAWGVGWIRKWRHVDNVALVGLTLLQLVVLAREESIPVLALTAVVGALVAWNGMAADRLATRVDHIPDPAALERRTVTRLLLIGGGGLVLGLIANTVRLNFGFGLAVVLALVAVLGLTRAIAFLRDAAE